MHELCARTRVHSAEIGISTHDAYRYNNSMHLCVAVSRSRSIFVSKLRLSIALVLNQWADWWQSKHLNTTNDFITVTINAVLRWNRQDLELIPICKICIEKKMFERENSVWFFISFSSMNGVFLHLNTLSKRARAHLSKHNATEIWRVNR